MKSFVLTIFFERRLAVFSRSTAIHRMAALTRYELVDIGANLTHPSFKDDLEDVINRAKQAGLCKIMLTGTSEKISKEISKIAEKHPGYLYFTAGVHPHDAKDFKESTAACLRDLLKHPQCVAVGECGLDYNRNFSPPEVQREIFKKQVEWAVELRKPLFIHEREASSDMLNILSSFGDQLPFVVIHCFTGTVDEAKVYLEKGYYIGLTGFLWKDRSTNGVQHGLKTGELPLDRLLLETDAPFMYPKVNDKKIPQEVRQKLTQSALDLHKFSSFNRNEPSSLPAICELIAAFMDKNPVEVAKITTENAKRIYGLQ
ncbi:unnamed protein product, partial [Mesorhabditis belari]|uniref:Deoxyribonuclease TATDN1 n=1 Tax=Mesorhabditis belari TaxID=2138241 RepID=A0AAF3F2S9_9BILA